jgi:hypothetical protein
VDESESIPFFLFSYVGHTAYCGEQKLLSRGLSVLKIWAMIMWQSEATVQTLMMLQWGSKLFANGTRSSGTMKG